MNLNLNAKRTRKQVFLEQMEQVVPWADLVALIASYYPERKNGRPPFPLMTMLRTHFMQHWLILSDPSMQEAFFYTPLLREFAQLEEFAWMPDESTIQWYRHRSGRAQACRANVDHCQRAPDCQGLATQGRHRGGDATLIAAPTSTKNKEKT